MPRFCHCLPLALVAALGCDLADYHRRMDLQRQRLKVFDEENKVLGKPLQTPSVEDAEGNAVSPWPFAVFLRLPKQIRAAAPTEKGDIIDYKGLLLFRYAGDGSTALLVAAANVGRDKDETEKGKDEGETAVSAESFRNWALWALSEYVRTNKEMLAVLDFDIKTLATKRLDIPATGADRPSSVAFEHLYCEAVRPGEKRTGHSLNLYHHVAGGRQIVLIFQSAKGEEDVRSLEMSLRTLALGNEAVARRAEYDRRRK